MRILDAATDVDGFWSALAAAEQRILMTDYDGVVAPFHPDPARAAPYPEIPRLLDRINGRDRSRVVVVSGRDVRDVSALLGMTTEPEVWGSHGHQHLAVSGEVSSPELDAEVKTALAEVQRLARRTAGIARVETKPYGVALHWRGTPAPELDGVRRGTDAFARSVAAEFAGVFVRHDFDGGIELLVRGRDKGAALTDILTAVGDCTAAYLGDDVTDEDAFRAAPRSVLTVLVRPELRATAAAAWLTPPDELVAFLERWDDVCQSGGSAGDRQG